MITINEDKELVSIKGELRNNGYKETVKSHYEKSYSVGKSWKNVKLKNGEILKSISIDHVVWLSSDSIEWSVSYIYSSDKNEDLLRTKDAPDLLLDQFNSSVQVLYKSIKQLKFSINKIASNSLLDDKDFLDFIIYSRELSVSEGIDELKKLLKNLPPTVKRIDSIMVRKQKGRF